MSYRYTKDNDTMKAFFRGEIKADNPNSMSRLVEIGHGTGTGHTNGSYSRYIAQLSKRQKEGNGSIYIGKAINEEKGTMSIVDPTEKFNTGDIPKLLTTFYSTINSMTIKIEWKNMENNTILEQYYQIPSPHSMNYDWWDTYSAYFIGPEDLEEGDYKVKITANGNTRVRSLKELSTTIEFSVEDKN